MVINLEKNSPPIIPEFAAPDGIVVTATELLVISNLSILLLMQKVLQNSILMENHHTEMLQNSCVLTA